MESGASTRRTRDRQRAVKGDRGAKKNAVKRVASAERRRKWAASRDKERERKNARQTDGKREEERERESWSMVYDIPLMAVVA